jgi:hypothetical protein
VNFLHRLTGLLHRLQGFVVDVGRFDRVYLLLQLDDLGRCLLEILFVGLLPSECGFGS